MANDEVEPRLKGTTPATPKPKSAASTKPKAKKAAAPKKAAAKKATAASDRKASIVSKEGTKKDEFTGEVLPVTAFPTIRNTKTGVNDSRGPVARKNLEAWREHKAKEKAAKAATKAKEKEAAAAKKAAEKAAKEKAEAAATA